MPSRRSELDDMLDGLQRGLSDILGIHPEPGRSSLHEAKTGHGDLAHVRARLDSILAARHRVDGERRPRAGD
jgi:hypothetical protein